MDQEIIDNIIRLTTVMMTNELSYYGVDERGEGSAQYTRARDIQAMCRGSVPTVSESELNVVTQARIKEAITLAQEVHTSIRGILMNLDERSVALSPCAMKMTAVTDLLKKVLRDAA